MKDKKAAKILIQRAKANPELYTDTEVKYAKLIKRTLKLSNNEQQLSENQSKIYWVADALPTHPIRTGLQMVDPRSDWWMVDPQNLAY